MSSLNFKKKIEKIQELEEEDMAASLIPRGEEIKQKQLQYLLQSASSASGNKNQGSIFDDEANGDDVDEDVGGREEQEQSQKNNEQLLNNKLTKYSIQAQLQSNDGSRSQKYENAPKPNGNTNMFGGNANPFQQSNPSFSMTDNLNVAAAGEDGNSHSESASSGSQTEQTALLQFKQSTSSSNNDKAVVSNLQQLNPPALKPYQLKPSSQLSSSKGMNQLGMSSQGGSSFGRRTFQRPSQVDEKLVDDVIDEDEEEDQVFDRDILQSSSSQQHIRANSKQGVSQLSGKDRKQFKMPQEKMEKYEEIKQESKITAYALSNLPRNQQITSNNYKSLISSYVK